MLETAPRVRRWTRCRSRARSETARDRHAAFFLALAEAAHAPAPRGRADLLAGPARSAPHDNLRAALAWLTETDDAAARAPPGRGPLAILVVALAPGRKGGSASSGLALPGVERRERPSPGCSPAAARWRRPRATTPPPSSTTSAAVAVWQDARRPPRPRPFAPLSLAGRVQRRRRSRMAALRRESLRLFQELDDPWGIAMSLMRAGRHGHAPASTGAGGSASWPRHRRLPRHRRPLGRRDLPGRARQCHDRPRATTPRGHGQLRESLTALLCSTIPGGLATVLPADARSRGRARAIRAGCAPLRRDPPAPRDARRAAQGAVRDRDFEPNLGEAENDLWRGALRRCV